jgi:hypothetical protein
MHAANQRGSVIAASENTVTEDVDDGIHLHWRLLSRFLGIITMPKAILTDINSKCQIEFPVDTGKRMTVYFIYVNGRVYPAHQAEASTITQYPS